jgi:hypothetical protein
VSRLRTGLLTPHEVVQRWIDALPDTTTNERVHNDLWYVRIPGVARSWIPIEIEVMEKSVKVTSQVIPAPDERHADVYELLLRHNAAAPGVAFGIVGRDPIIALVSRIPHDELTGAKLDLLVGQMVEETESTFRTILETGFASRLRRR